MPIDEGWSHIIKTPTALQRVLHTLTRVQALQLKNCIIDFSLPIIDDAMREKYVAVFCNNGALSSKEQVGYFVDNSPYWWHAREWGRFIVGYHVPIPVPEVHTYADYAKHFPHISREDKTRVAIIMDEKKAVQDVHTTMKIGRYLSKQTSAPESIIPDASNEYANRNKAHQVLIARTRAEIQWVYENGPDSCMGKPAAHFRARVHPTQAYASPDFSVMYIKDPENSTRVVARTVYSNINKQYVRIFGNVTLLKKALVNIGVRGENRDLRGHRLLKIVDKDMHIGPYLDSNISRTVYAHATENEHLIIDPRDKTLAGKHVGTTSRSYSGKGYIDTAPNPTCSVCDDEIGAGEEYRFEGFDETFCNDCYEANTVKVMGSSMGTFRIPLSAVNSTYTVPIHTSYHKLAPDPTLVAFVSRNAFLSAASIGLIQPYKYSEDTFIMPAVAAHIFDTNIYVHKLEAIALSYTDINILKAQAIRVNGVWMDKRHIKANGKFILDTISGIPIKEIKANPQIFYYTTITTASVRGNTRHVMKVSRTPRRNFQSINDMWLHQLSNASAFEEYRGVRVDQLTPSIHLYLLPDDPSESVYNKQLSQHRLKMTSSPLTTLVTVNVDTITSTLDKGFNTISTLNTCSSKSVLPRRSQIL